jgi:hypothetical protein
VGNGATPRRLVGRTWLRAAAVAVSVAALIAAIVTGQFAFGVLAIVAVMFLAMTLGATGRLPEKLQGFRGRAVVVRVWGKPLPIPGDEAPTVTSIWALGAGLHFHIRVGDASAMHLKVAQPAHVLLAEDAVTIAGAKYVQWSGRSLMKVPGAPALTISLIPRPSGE